jgi:hypothetical protein
MELKVEVGWQASVKRREAQIVSHDGLFKCKIVAL